MSKKSLFFGSIAVVITVLLMFVGCSQADDPVTTASTGVSGGAGTITLKGSLTAYELANELKAYGEVTLIGDYREVVAIHDYQDGQIVPTVLHIPDNSTLVVGKNVTLVFDNDRLSIAEKGTLKVADGGVLILYNNDQGNTNYPNPTEITSGNIIGELIIEEGGTFFDMNPAGSTWGSGAPDEGTGKIIVKAGSRLYSGGRAPNYYPTGFTGATGSTGSTGYGSYVLNEVNHSQYRVGTNSNAIVQLLNGEAILTKDKLELNGDASVWGRYDSVPGNPRDFGNGGGTLTFQINEGSTATLQDNTLFWFTAGAPILGEGKLVAGKTEIVGGTGGGWTVGGPLGSGNDTVLIGAADDRTSSIAVYTSTPNAVLIGSAGASITQKIGTDSELSLGDATTPLTVNLGGTVSSETIPNPIAGAQFILEGDPNWTATNNIAGSVLFGNAGSVIIGGQSAGVAFASASPLTTASKIGGKTVGKLPGISSTLAIYTDTVGVGGTPASGNFLGIRVTTANDGISSGSIENLIIDSTMLVE
jgi:hypothetical protein